MIYGFNNCRVNIPVNLMKKERALILSVFYICCLYFFTHGEETPSKVWVDASAYREMGIVIPENASPMLQHAGEIFKKYWELCTRRPIEITNQNQKPINIWLGAELCTREWIDPVELEELGEEGFIIRTYTPTRKYVEKGVAKQLLICGKTDIGTLHGVYTFFEKFLNVAWFASDYTFTPTLGFTLKEIDYKYSPHFEFRYLISNIPEFNITGERSEGLHLTHSPPKQDWSPISFHDLGLNDKTSNEAQAEKYCFSNVETKNKIFEILSKQIEIQPDRKIWNLLVDFGDNPCPCEQCRVCVEKVGTPMGPFLNVMNEVVSQLEQKFINKDFYFCLSLKENLRKPPRDIKIHNRIFIELPTDSCDVLHAINDSNSLPNAQFMEHLKGWRKITRNLIIRYYTGVNYHCGLFPLPDLVHYQRNIQAFDQFQVRGIIVSAMTVEPWAFSEWDSLKSYLLAKLLWDPDLIFEEELNAFITRYYNMAGTRIKQYFNLLNDYVKSTPKDCSVYQKIPWWNVNFIKDALDVFQKALLMNQPDTVIYNRVIRVVVPVYYAVLFHPLEGSDEYNREKLKDVVKEDEFWKFIDKIESSIEKDKMKSYRDTLLKNVQDNTSPSP